MARPPSKQRARPDCGSQGATDGNSNRGIEHGADGSFSLAALPTGQYKLTIIAKGKTAVYAQAITLSSDPPVVVIALSVRGEITVAAQQGTGATNFTTQFAINGQRDMAVPSLPMTRFVVI